MKVFQSALTLCDPMDYSVLGIFQTRMLEWVVVPFYRASSQARDWTLVSQTAGGFFINWATREVQEHWTGGPIPSLGGLSLLGKIFLIFSGRIKPGSPALQAGSVPAELQGNPLSNLTIAARTAQPPLSSWLSFLSFLFLLTYSWLTVMHPFLLYGKVGQSYTWRHSTLKIFFAIMIYQDIEYSSLCYTVEICHLSVQCMTVDIC